MNNLQHKIERQMVRRPFYGLATRFVRIDRQVRAFVEAIWCDVHAVSVDTTVGCVSLQSGGASAERSLCATRKSLIAQTKRLLRL